MKSVLYPDALPSNAHPQEEEEDEDEEEEEDGEEDGGAKKPMSFEMEVYLHTHTHTSGVVCMEWCLLLSSTVLLVGYGRIVVLALRRYRRIRALRS